MNGKLKIKNVKLLAVLAFLIFNFTFLIQSPAQAERTDRFIVGSTCFRKEECTSLTYKGLLGPIDPFCTKASPLHSEGAIQRGFNYSCYAAPVPYKLQVPFLTPAFFGTAPSFENYIEQLYKFLIAIAGVLAGIMIIWAGVKWLTSAGNPERIGDATKKIAGALVGLVLVLSSYLLLNTINPDLVRLRLPPVKLIRQVGEVKETKCKNDLKFPCGGKRTEPLYSIHGQTPPQFFPPDTTDTGAYRCDKYPNDNPCGANEASDCIGIACEQGECADIVEERITPEAKALLQRIQGYNSAITTKRACFNRSACQGCNIPITITNPGDTGRLDLEADRNLHLCASRACNCVVSVREDEDDRLWLQCIKQKGTGENCSANAECEEGMQCIPGGVRGVVYTLVGRLTVLPGQFFNRPPPSGVCGVPQADGFACHEASDCGSGICGAVTTTGLAYVCVGGQGSDCGENKRCVNGLRCVDTAGGGGTCSDGRVGAPCCSIADCGGRLCQGEVSAPGGSLCAWAGRCR